MAALVRNLWKGKAQGNMETFIREAIDDRMRFTKPFRDLARNYIEVQEKTSHTLGNSSLTWREARRLRQGKQQAEKDVHNLFRDHMFYHYRHPAMCNNTITMSPVLTASLATVVPTLIGVDLYVQMKKK